MKKLTVKVGPKGEVVIPKEIRDETRIVEGSEVVMQVRGGDVVIRAASPPTKSYVDYFTTTYSPKVKLLVDIKKIVDEEYVGRANIR